MKRLAVISLAFLAVLALAAGPVAATVSELLSRPDAFDQKEVKTSGKVTKFEQRISKAGNAYFVFKLEEKEKRVSVYGHGTLSKPLREGDAVEVVGKFRKENKVGSQVFNNEIETTTEKVKPRLSIRPPDGR